MAGEQLTRNNLKQQIEYSKQIELAMLNILEDGRELEISLKNERDKTIAIVSSIGEGLLVVDNDYKIVLINDVAARFLEVSVAGVIGIDAKEVINIYKGNEKLPDEKRPVAENL